MFKKALMTLACVATVALSSTAYAQDKTVVRMGSPALGLWMLPVLVAEDKGMLAKEGLTVTMNYMRGGSEAAAALIGGNIDVMIGALSGVMILRSKGVAVKALSAVAGVRTFALVVDAKRHANVTSIQQIKGMKIATSRRGSDGDLVTRVLLSDANLSPEKDVSLIQIGGYDNQLLAIQKGEIDGAMILEPFLTTGIKRGIIKPVVNLMAGQGPEALRKRVWTALSTTESFIEKRPKVAQGLVRGIAAAVRYLATNQDGAVEVAQKHFPKLNPELLREIVKNNINIPGGRGFLTEISPEAIDLEDKFLVSEKFIPSPLQYKDVVDVDMTKYWHASGK
jgi:NitT/TauT family transport system substrate-binding protein